MRPLISKYRIIRADVGGKHLYSIVDDPEYQNMSSVTHYTGVINKPQLNVWYAKQAVAKVRAKLVEHVGLRLNEFDVEDILHGAVERGEDVKVAAADYGTQVHAAIDHFILKGKWPAYNKEIEPAIQSFMKWWGPGRNILMGDTFVASKRYRYGGAFDAIEVRDDGLWIQDWKSSNGIWDEMAIQVGGGYSLAFEETFGMPAAGATIVRFGKKEPEFEALDVANLAVAQAAFKHARGLRLALDSELFVKPKKEKKERKNGKGIGRKADGAAV